MTSPDPVIDFVCRTACAAMPVQRIWLFGSRARGDNHDRSDYDFALQVSDAAGWNRLWNEVDEHAPTLCGIDLVDFERAPDELRANILAQGRVVYGG